MIPEICVEIDQNDYVKLLSLDKASSEELNLTTICDLQTRAIIKVLLFKRDKPFPIHEIDVSNIPPQEAGQPEISLLGEYDGRRNLFLNVILNGASYTRKKIDLKRFIKRRRKGWLLLAIPILLLVFLVFFFKDRVDFNWRIPGKIISGVSLNISELWAKIYKTEEHTEKLPVRESETETTGAEESAEDITDTHEPAVDESKSRQVETIQQEEIAGPKRDTSKQIGPPGPTVMEKETVYFHADSSVLTSSAQEKLDALLSFLGENPDVTVTISGHCALFGTEQLRIRLSMNRAFGVRDYLLASGWNPRSELKVLSQGGSYPITMNPAMQHLNRRVEIEIDRQQD